MNDRLALRLSIMGAIALSFFAGVLAQRYDYTPVVMREGMESAEVWWSVLKERSGPEAPRDVDEAIAKSKVTGGKGFYGDYTLINLFGSTSSYLVDKEGKLVYRWDLPFEKAWPNPRHVRNIGTKHVRKSHVFPNGDLLVLYETYGDTPYGYGLAKTDRHSRVLWTYDANAHHDFYIDAHNGNIYVLTQEFLENPPRRLSKDKPLVDFIVILSPDGRELNKIPILDAFMETSYQTMLFRTVSDPSWDYMHTNSIMKLEPEWAAAFPRFAPGQILISIRNIGLIAVIDPDTHKTVWAAAGIWAGQHDAHFVENGHIALFDNRGFSTSQGNFSRILEIDPNTQVVTSLFFGYQKQPFFSMTYGRQERLPNGNTLIAESNSAHMFEIDRKGNIVWDYRLPKPIARGDNGVPLPDTDMGENNRKYTIVSALRYSKKTLPFLETAAKP